MKAHRPLHVAQTTSADASRAGMAALLVFVARCFVLRSVICVSNVAGDTGGLSRVAPFAANFPWITSLPATSFGMLSRLKGIAGLGM